MIAGAATGFSAGTTFSAVDEAFAALVASALAGASGAALATDVAAGLATNGLGAIGLPVLTGTTLFTAPRRADGAASLASTENFDTETLSLIV